MKGPLGIVVAAVLGLFGVALNWLYLQGKTKDVESVSFLGVSSEANIQSGDVLREEHFTEVKIPKRSVGDLKDFVYLYQDRNTVVGIRATRKYQGGDLVLRQDYRTPPPELKLAADERLIWIPVDSRSFVPELVDPGDEITFLLTRSSLGTPTPAGGGESGAPPKAESTEMIGPFTIGSLGSRLGSREVTSASRLSQGQERQVGIVVKVEGEGLEAKASRLLERVQQSSRSITVALHPRRLQK